MSRTDKDRPWQICANDLFERRRRKSPAYFSHNEYDHIRHGSCHDGCGWTLPHHYLSQPPRDFVRAVWFGPERARERDGLAKIRKDYNLNYFEAEEDFYNKQHRHQAHWLWC